MKEKLIEELKDLSFKIVKLALYLEKVDKTSPCFDPEIAASCRMVSVLKDQYKAMSDYARALNKRIADLD